MIVRRMREEIMIAKLRTMIRNTDDMELIAGYMHEIGVLEQQRRKIIFRENSSMLVERDDAINPIDLFVADARESTRVDFFVWVCYKENDPEQ